MTYFGRLIALLRVWEGSKHIRIFPGLVGWGLSLERPCQLDIQSVGCDTQTSWPVVSWVSNAALIDSSFEMGW